MRNINVRASVFDTGNAFVYVPDRRTDNRNIAHKAGEEPSTTSYGRGWNARKRY